MIGRVPLLWLVLISVIGVPLAHSQPGLADTSDVWRALQETERTVPRSGDHPGNVFLADEDVSVRVPASVPPEAIRWRLLDDQGAEVRNGDMDAGQARTRAPIGMGALGIGWYRLEFLDRSENCIDWTTAAVVARLAEPVPQDSPICVDGAASWFARDDPDVQEDFARLAALCGVNWIRDRVRWRDIQPEPNLYVEETTTYDTAAFLQSQFGLKVLQVFHDTPPWAVEGDSSRARFPRDLRIVYRFCREMARRFHGRVQAWEPWNEANTHSFGGHTAVLMCTFQKAAYLGFKAGDSSLTVCWNAYCGAPTDLHARIVLENETWPYFDTYNTHTYDWPHAYEALWKPVRKAACGRPIWITESDRGLQYQTDEPWCDLSREDELAKAEFMAQSYASSLFAGSNRHFHFILGHYFEPGNRVQFGLLRLDLTPRPSFSALAAVGRFLAGARCLGRWRLEDQPHAHIYAFRTRPDGVNRDVIVAWAEKPVDWPQRGKTTVAWTLPTDVAVESVFDYLGRPLGEGVPGALTSRPVFVVLPEGEANKLPLVRPAKPEYREGDASHVVFQLQMPEATVTRVEEKPWAQEYEYKVEPGKEIELPIFVYNFSETPVHGDVTVVHAPDGWTLTPDSWQTTTAPMDRTRLTARFTMPRREGDRSSDTWIRIRGEFGSAGQPVLAFRLITFPGEGYVN